MRPHDKVSEDDLIAYVDEQLVSARREQVEHYLAHHPSDARRILADRRIRSALREVLCAGVLPTDRKTRALGSRLKRVLKIRRWCWLARGSTWAAVVSRYRRYSSLPRRD